MDREGPPLRVSGGGGAEGAMRLCECADRSTRTGAHAVIRSPGDQHHLRVQVKEILVEESNVQPVNAPVTVSE